MTRRQRYLPLVSAIQPLDDLTGLMVEGINYRCTNAAFEEGTLKETPDHIYSFQ